MARFGSRRRLPSGTGLTALWGSRGSPSRTTSPEGCVSHGPSLDRLARALENWRWLVLNPTGRGVTARFITEGLTFTRDDSPLATLWLSVMGAFAEFEWALSRERQAAGIALAQQRGVHQGGRGL